MEREYKVATQCFTYNQASYILDTLAGFEIQQVNFKSVFIIVDDCSTDGESDLLRTWACEHLLMEDENSYSKKKDYGELYFAVHKQNANAYYAILLLSENHYQTGKGEKKFEYIKEWFVNAEYHAICEGDDYWVNPAKLQMQVDFMDSHKDYVLCYTDHDIHGGGYRNHEVFISSDDNYFPHSIINGLKIGTLTVLYRADVYERLPKHWIGKEWPMGDKPLWIELSHEGKIKFIPIITAHYRMLFGTASHASLEKDISGLVAGIEIVKYYAKIYGVKLSGDGYNKVFYLAVMKSAFRHRDKKSAHKYYNKAKEKHQLSTKTCVLYYATIFEPLGELLSWTLKGYYTRPKE